MAAAADTGQPKTVPQGRLRCRLCWLTQMDSRTKKTNNKRFVRYSEGAEMYSMSVSKFMQLAKDAKACYKVNQLVLVNLDINHEYLETFHIVDDEFYK